MVCHPHAVLISVARPRRYAAIAQVGAPRPRPLRRPKGGTVAPPFACERQRAGGLPPRGGTGGGRSDPAPGLARPLPGPELVLPVGAARAEGRSSKGRDRPGYRLTQVWPESGAPCRLTPAWASGVCELRPVASGASGVSCHHRRSRSLQLRSKRFALQHSNDC